VTRYIRDPYFQNPSGLDWRGSMVWMTAIVT